MDKSLEGLSFWISTESQRADSKHDQMSDAENAVSKDQWIPLGEIKRKIEKHGGILTTKKTYRVLLTLFDHESNKSIPPVKQTTHFLALGSEDALTSRGYQKALADETEIVDLDWLQEKVPGLQQHITYTHTGFF